MPSTRARGAARACSDRYTIRQYAAHVARPARRRLANDSGAGTRCAAGSLGGTLRGGSERRGMPTWSPLRCSVPSRICSEAHSGSRSLAERDRHVVVAGESEPWVARGGCRTRRDGGYAMSVSGTNASWPASRCFWQKLFRSAVDRLGADRVGFTFIRSSPRTPIVEAATFRMILVRADALGTHARSRRDEISGTDAGTIAPGWETTVPATSAATRAASAGGWPPTLAARYPPAKASPAAVVSTTRSTCDAGPQSPPRRRLSRRSRRADLCAHRSRYVTGADRGWRRRTLRGVGRRDRVSRRHPICRVDSAADRVARIPRESPVVSGHAAARCRVDLPSVDGPRLGSGDRGPVFRYYPRVPGPYLPQAQD